MTMQPSDVPADLVALACEVYVLDAPLDEDDARHILAMVLPDHERMVREQVAAEIEADPTMTNAEMTALARLDDDPEHEQCAAVWSRYAARIARGHQDAPTTPAQRAEQAEAALERVRAAHAQTCTWAGTSSAWACPTCTELNRTAQDEPERDRT